MGYMRGDNEAFGFLAFALPLHSFGSEGDVLLDSGHCMLHAD